MPMRPKPPVMSPPTPAGSFPAGQVPSNPAPPLVPRPGGTTVTSWVVDAQTA